MRIETVIQRINERQRSLEQGLCAKPVSEWGEYRKQVGIWQGLNDALGVISEEARKDQGDE